MPFRLFNTKMILAAMAALIMFSSCKKDKDNDPVPFVEKKIAKVYQDPNNFIEFIYGTDGTLSQVKFAEEETPGGVQTMNISYGPNKKISSILLNDEYRIEYLYENGLLAQTHTKDEKGHIVMSDAYHFVNGQLKHHGQFLPFPLEDGNVGIWYKIVNESKFNYNNNNTVRSVDNLMRNPITDKMEPSGSILYNSYDGKINPLKSLGEFSYAFFQQLNPSNITRETTYDAAGAVEKVVERTYTYDNHGYPLTCMEKTTETGQPAESKTLTFSYK